MIKKTIVFLEPISIEHKVVVEAENHAALIKGLKEVDEAKDFDTILSILRRSNNLDMKSYCCDGGKTDCCFVASCHDSTEEEMEMMD